MTTDMREENGKWVATDWGNNDPKVLADYAALAFLRWLEARYPDVRWVRVRDDA